MQTAVIYARYSSGPNQNEQSIEGQVRECLKYAETHDLKVVDQYIDRKISGRTDNRHEFQRMIEDSGKKLFQAVIVYHTDRFARNRYDSVVYKRHLQQNGVKLYYATGDLPDGPEGIILESVMEGWAEYYSAELSRKIKRGMRENALKCRSTGAGHTLGYTTAPDKTFVIDEKGAQAVRTVFDMYVKGKSNTEICDYLNGLGFRTIRGKPFNKSSVSHIIKNRRYIGTYTYDDIVIEDGIPAIITKDVFQLAQQELARRRTAKRPAAPRAEYLLSGKAFCGHCGAPEVGVSGTGKNGAKKYYYYCRATRGLKRSCTKKPIRRDWLEDKVVEETLRHVLQPEIIKHISEVCHSLQVEDRDANSDVLFYQGRLSELDKYIANITKAIATGVITETLPKQLAEYENERRQTEHELARAKAMNVVLSAEQIEFMLWQFTDLQDGETWDEYKRKIIKCFVHRVYVFDDKLLIHYNVSRDGSTREKSETELFAEAQEVFDQRAFGSTSSSAGQTPTTLIIGTYSFWLALKLTAQE